MPVRTAFDSCQYSASGFPHTLMHYTGSMDFAEIYHFIFETYAGLGILMGGCLIICVILAFVLEVRTRKRYRDRGERKEGKNWFDASNEEDEEAAES